ncbi:S1 RNA-binding domain-containing protein [Streptomyces sp. NBC_01296]|uniref:S1 RNA-binding domain-containing protein n=1 Tax=Streptomyces sp. NBC_01296 TaxID=2903816 RepID=UPI002E1664C2|nr:S1 RNA-binding domain-containing protein [Streptomyces sp. NBC_01296]
MDKLPQWIYLVNGWLQQPAESKGIALNANWGERWKPGDVCRGTVSEVASFGLFVDLDGDVGVVTAANLSWTPVTHPSQIAQVGQTVTAIVLSVDPFAQQISLSLKGLTPDPLAAFAVAKINAETIGIVSRITPIGSFVEIREGFTGLLEESATESDPIGPQIGDSVSVRVKRINITTRQILVSRAE